MENKINDQPKLTEKIFYILKTKKKLFLIFIFLVIITLSGVTVLKYLKEKQNIKISENYIQAGILLSSKEKEESKNIYKKIVLSKNKFYSLLALNNIIENELEKNSNEILKLFEVVESITKEKDESNLIKLKKSLYLMKISKNEEANELLNQIISSDSIWRETALELIK